MAGISERVVAVISPRSIEGTSIFDIKASITASTVDTFRAEREDARFVSEKLIELGFEVLNFHPIATSFSGTPAQFRDLFGVRLDRQRASGGRGRQLDFLRPDADDVCHLLDPPAIFAGKAEGIAIAQPPRLVDGAGPAVRDVDADHRGMRCLPDELAGSIRANGRSSLRATGRGVVAAMIGTGHYRHGFFAERGFKVLPTLLGPGQSSPLVDEHGHATGEAACLLATAPDLRLRPIKGLLDPTGDMLLAVESAPRPDLIVNGWGYDVDRHSWRDLADHDLNLYRYLRTLEAAIAHATAAGIVVCAATAPAWRSFPAAHPDVIAIAAAASPEKAAISRLYPRRPMPDFWSDAARRAETGTDLDLTDCIQPVQAGSVLNRLGKRADRGHADGWGWCDEASAACPLVAGMIALLLEQNRGLAPADVKQLMAALVGTGARTDGMAAVAIDPDHDDADRALVLNRRPAAFGYPSDLTLAKAGMG